MTEQMLRVVLETANAKNDKDGWAALPEGRVMTLHVAHAGVGLTVSKVEAVHIASSVVRARSQKGEVVVLAADDVFAATVDKSAEAAANRKAGFLG